MMLLDSRSESGRCLYCGSHVSLDFRRVYGDDDDRAHRCFECDTLVRLQRGSAGGLDVPIPDPWIAPGRHGGDPERWS
ncbi:hypothetical protein C440_12679 [Haloferax mucosum ATCC BAA-1512]|uniref:Small CPxCG-related zinc finger protein n=1 Tax=Haloferax mucosum ATCC BAA-1512 TaxID=662479 RepID=M0I833_9EURY|nr:hypothetical protein [Haloferax mucosum]ELZ92975.1 hypothetical protein C440_12679 [Haloferax mucosum ATCC BAA-1512]